MDELDLEYYILQEPEKEDKEVRRLLEEAAQSMIGVINRVRSERNAGLKYYRIININDTPMD